MTLPDGALAYKFFNKANILDQHKQLVHATLTELKYANRKDKINKFLVTLKNFPA